MTTTNNSLTTEPFPELPNITPAHNNHHNTTNQHHKLVSMGSVHNPRKVPLSHASPVHHDVAAEPDIILLVEEEIVEPAVVDNVMNENRLKFQDRSKRMKFVRSVLLALGLQLTICAGFILFCTNIEELKDFSKTTFGQSIAWIAMILWFILVSAVGCFRIGHGKPKSSNTALLIVSTLLLAVSTAVITVEYHIFALMYAGFTTAGVVLIIALITCCTKLDITSMLVYVVGVVLALTIFTFVVTLFLFTQEPEVVSWNEEGYRIQTILSGIAAVIYVVLIMMHLQLIVGGGAYEYGEDDWLLASIMLFFDIFMFFLAVLGMIRK